MASFALPSAPSAAAAAAADGTAALYEGSAASNGAMAATQAAPTASSLYVRVSQAVLVLTCVGVVALGAFVIVTLVQQGGVETPRGAWAVAGIFVGVAVPVSVHDMHLHVVHYVSPLQRFYIRILGMVVIYAVESWCALGFPAERIYLEAARECYEAYVLYSFFALMIGFLGGRPSLAARLRLRAKRTGVDYLAHLPPCSCFCRRGWRAGSRFVHRTSVGVYLYVLLRVVSTIAIVISEASGTYAESWANPTYCATSVVINVAQMAALYSLALFYVHLREELRPLRPLGKFAVIKAVVFLSWWQGLAVSGAVDLGLIPSLSGFSADDVGAGLQDFAICVEMAVAAIAHAVVFSYADFDSAEDSPVRRMQRQQRELESELLLARAAARAAIATTPRGSAAARPPDLERERRVRGTPGGVGGDSAEAEDDGGEGDDGVGGAARAAVDALELRPRGVSAAVLDVLPLDLLQETRENVASGFGLVHKREKRRRDQRRATRDWARHALDEVGTPASGETNDTVLEPPRALARPAEAPRRLR